MDGLAVASVVETVCLRSTACASAEPTSPVVTSLNEIRYYSFRRNPNVDRHSGCHSSFNCNGIVSSYPHRHYYQSHYYSTFRNNSLDCHPRVYCYQNHHYHYR